MGSFGYLELLLIVTGLAIVVGMVRAYSVSRDPFHPMIFISPMLLYVFAFRPAVLLNNGGIQRLFSADQLTFVLGLKAASVICFCLGCTYHVWWRRKVVQPAMVRQLTPVGRDWAFLVACLLGAVSLLAFLVMLRQAGGFVRAYSNPYSGAGVSHSGYIVDAPTFSLAAVAMLAIARQGRPLRIQDVFLALAFASPLLIQGFLGARRGPTFMGLVILWVGYYIYQKRRPSLGTTLATVTVLGLLVLAILTFRREIYLGSKLNVRSDDYVQALLDPKDVGPGEDFVDSSGMILTVSRFGRHTWGGRLAVTYFVRPIPRQLWPNKYADCGFAWFDTKIERYGYSDIEWQNAAGFIPIVGMAIGFDASFYLDFWWFGLVGCFLSGLLFSWIWAKDRQHKGIWQLLLATCLGLSIFFPTQDFSSFFYRWLLITIPSAVLWRLLVVPNGLGATWRRVPA